jgi:hypothetical protein
VCLKCSLEHLKLPRNGPASSGHASLEPKTGPREERGLEQRRGQRREGAREERGLEERGAQRREGAREGKGLGARRALVPEKSGCQKYLDIRTSLTPDTLACSTFCSLLLNSVPVYRLGLAWPSKHITPNSVNALLEYLPPCCSLYELHSEYSISYFSTRVLHG